jgi:hypothetical protein
MSPQEKTEFEQMKKDLDNLKRNYFLGDFPDKKVYYKTLVAQGGMSFTQSVLGFFGVTPVAQQSAVTSPSGGGGSSTDAIDISARTSIGQIKTALQNLGLTA